jgi:hypothetical protein
MMFKDLLIRWPIGALKKNLSYGESPLKPRWPFSPEGEEVPHVSPNEYVRVEINWQGF